MSQITQFVQIRQQQLTVGEQLTVANSKAVAIRLPASAWDRVNRLAEALKVSRQEMASRLIASALDEAEEALK